MSASSLLPPALAARRLDKLPEITLGFWILKICATTLGETAGDLLSMTLQIGYALSSIILLGFFAATLAAQLGIRRHIPTLYWAVILATSTAGTTMSDYMDRTLGLGYATGSLILLCLLLAILGYWRITEKLMSVSHIRTLRVEILYWTAILCSNTLGTALGDYLADDSGLGFAGGAFLIGSIIAGMAALAQFTSISKVLLFWLAFVFTRPFGATCGDLLTKSPAQGGLGFGTIGSSAVLFAVLVIGVIIATARQPSYPAERALQSKITPAPCAGKWRAASVSIRDVAKRRWQMPASRWTAAADRVAPLSLAEKLSTAHASAGFARRNST